MENKPKHEKSDRRNFLKLSLSLGAGTLTGSGMISACSPGDNETEGEKVKVLLPSGELAEIDSSAVRTKTQRVSHEDSRKGDPNKSFVMVVDLAKCRHARKCVESCQHMHHLAPEAEWIKIFLMQDSEDTAKYWFPKPCFHCSSPSCVNVCPVGATFKRLDGLVLIDNDRCIGCKFCMAACPYSSRVFNWKEPEYKSDVTECGDPETSVPQVVGTVGKCDFCPDMAYNGKLPACINACPNGVLYFGDRNEDVVSNGVETLQFSKLIYERAGYKFMEELGTRPNVFYLPPVNRLFDPDKSLEDLPEEIRERYNVNRTKIKKETR